MFIRNLTSHGDPDTCPTIILSMSLMVFLDMIIIWTGTKAKPIALLNVNGPHLMSWRHGQNKKDKEVAHPTCLSFKHRDFLLSVSWWNASSTRVPSLLFSKAYPSVLVLKSLDLAGMRQSVIWDLQLDDCRSWDISASVVV